MTPATSNYTSICVQVSKKTDSTHKRRRMLKAVQRSAVMNGLETVQTFQRHDREQEVEIMKRRFSVGVTRKDINIDE